VWLLVKKNMGFFGPGGCRRTVCGGRVYWFRGLYQIEQTVFINNNVPRDKNFPSRRTITPIGFDYLIETK
jgi:hypothetical protein